MIIPALWRHPRDYREVVDAVNREDNTERVFYENMASIEQTLEMHRLSTVPVGGVVVYAGYNPPPEGYLLADGAQVLIDGYTDLYNILTDTGNTFPFGNNTDGSGNPGTTHFYLPNPTPPGGLSYIIKY